MKPEDREALIEAASTAFRERDPDGVILPSPAWLDLPPADREAAFEAQVASRMLEAAFDPEGLDATARVVLAGVMLLPQLRP